MAPAPRPLGSGETLSCVVPATLLDPFQTAVTIGYLVGVVLIQAGLHSSLSRRLVRIFRARSPLAFPTVGPWPPLPGRRLAGRVSIQRVDNGARYRYAFLISTNPLQKRSAVPMRPQPRPRPRRPATPREYTGSTIVTRNATATYRAR
jgi:hypothetical protein